MKKIGFIFIFLISFYSCNQPTSPVNNQSSDSKSWQAIPELAKIKFMSVVKYKDMVFAAGNDSTDWVGYIYCSKDALNWELVKKFERRIGPMTIHGDSLFCLCYERLMKYVIPKKQWITVCNPSAVSYEAGAMGDMVFYKNELYTMQSEFTNEVSTYRLGMDGKVTELLVLYGHPYGGTKFYKRIVNGEEIIYVRGQADYGGFYLFDGEKFTDIKGGLPDSVYYKSLYNAMGEYNGEFFAGFSKPSVIKKLNSANIWENYTDTLPVSESAYRLNPVVKTAPTAITFVNGRMFVATQCLGVLEWDRATGWKEMSDGLVKSIWWTYYNLKDLYEPIMFLENLNGYLIAGYGHPAASYECRSGGLYIYKIK